MESQIIDAQKKRVANLLAPFMKPGDVLLEDKELIAVLFKRYSQKDSNK